MGIESLSIDANTFQFFTRNPRGGSAKEIDPADAKKLNDLMAEKGFAKAQCDLGALYLFGRGVPADAAKALSLYKKAAEQGNDIAMVSLGMMYHRGMGTPKNTEEAIKWWKKASDKGNENAILILKKILDNK